MIEPQKDREWKKAWIEEQHVSRECFDLINTQTLRNMPLNLDLFVLCQREELNFRRPTLMERHAIGQTNNPTFGQKRVLDLFYLYVFLSLSPKPILDYIAKIKLCL